MSGAAEVAEAGAAAVADNDDDDDGEIVEEQQPPASDAVVVTVVDGTGSDEERRKLLKPLPDADRILDVLRKRYKSLADNGTKEEETDEDGDNENGNNKKKDGDGDDEPPPPTFQVLQQLDSYDDVNYKVRIGTGTYLLKVHNGVESEDFLRSLDDEDEQDEGTIAATASDDDLSSPSFFYRRGKMRSHVHLQNAVLELLSEHGVSTSFPVKCDTGSPVVVADLPVVSSSSGESSSPPPTRRLVVRLLHWVEGTPLSAVDESYSLEVLADAGFLLGTVDRILDNVNDNSLAAVVAASDNNNNNNGGGGGNGNSSNSAHAEAMARFPQLESNVEMLSRGSMMVASTNCDDKGKNGGGGNVVEGGDKKPAAESGTATKAATTTAAHAVLDESLLIPARKYHQWDGKNTCDLRRFVRYIGSARRRELVVSVIDAFQREILDSGVSKRFRTGILHGDFNDANIIVDDRINIVGCIDVGDSVERYVAGVTFVVVAFLSYVPRARPN